MDGKKNIAAAQTRAGRRLTSTLSFFLGAFTVQTLLSLVGLAPGNDPPVLFMVAAAISLIMTASAFAGQYAGNRNAAPPPAIWALLLGAACPIMVGATTHALGMLGASHYFIVASFVLPGFILGWLASQRTT